MKRLIIFLCLLVIVLSCKIENRKELIIHYNTKKKILKFEGKIIDFNESIENVIKNFGDYEKKRSKQLPLDNFYSKLYPIILSNNKLITSFHVYFVKELSFKTKFLYKTINFYFDDILIDNESVNIDSIRKEFDKKQISYNK